MKHLASLLVVLSVCSFSSRVRAGAQEAWQTSQLDMHSGLGDNCVNDVLVDARHFLWIGTNAGLVFYDGCNMVQVAFPETENAVPPVIFSLSEDEAGVVWAGTSEGLFHIDKDRLEMRRLDREEFRGASFRQMCCGKDASLWVAADERDVLKINTLTAEIVTVPLAARSVCGSPDGTVYALSSDHRLFVLTGGAPYSVNYHYAEMLEGITVSRIAYAGGSLFLFAENGGVYAIELESKELRFLSFVSRVRDAAGLSDGEIYLAARDGIQVLDSTLAPIRVIRPLRDNSFRCLSVDPQGGVWAGTLFEGLAHIAPDVVRFRRYGDEFAPGRFKARDFAETPDGRIWTGTDTRGLLCLAPSAPERAAKQFFPGRNVTGLMAEGRFLWVGTIDNELPVMRLDTESGKAVAFPGAGKSAYAFCRDTQGRLWIGGQDGFVVGREGADGRFDVEISMPTKQVCRILCASDGAVWVASINGSIIRYKSSDYATYKIPISNILTDIIEDGKGRVFATSEGTGLWEYKRETDAFQSVGLTDTRLLKISREGDLLWITGSHGIQILNPDDSRPLPLISTEILGIDSFNYSSNFISADGTLYAGTSDGFISFSVRSLREAASVVRKPSISSFRILSSSEKTEGGRFLRPEAMLLDSKTRSFEVSVSLLDYALFPVATLFWKIDGLGEWTQVEDGRFTVYDIPSGRWKLRLKAVSLSGEESEETVMDLRVRPPLLLSPMAFVLYIVFFLIIAFGIAVIVERKAKAKAEMEQERKILASKMDFLTSIAHEIRTPLSLVQIPLEELIRKFSSSADGSVQENLDIMRRNSMKLTVLINELLDFRKLTDSTYQIHPEFLDIRTVLKDAHRRFLPMFVQEGKTLSIQMREAPVYCETDVRSLGRIFDNLLSNALKYSAHHTVIRLSVSGHEAVVSVENDGTIIPEDVREEIFKPFYRYDDAASAGVEGTGLGLSTSRQFATLLGGSLSMDDDMGVNRFLFTIPVSAEESPGSGLPVVESKDKSIMVVEDDRDMSRVIGDILSESYNIIYASNGREALEKIEAGASPTLVVSDVIMPETDGIALTRALKGNLATSHIPVILLSAEVPDVFMQESLEGGADAYLEKPFSPKKLRSTVDNLIENRKRVYEFYVSSLPSDGELPTGRVSAQEQKFLRSIQEYVNANLHRSITLDDLAEVVYLSPSTLYKKMKDYADVSPMEYVMKVRLHRAVELLKDDSVSVQEVAQSVGFNTHSFFSECFKREFGMTPRQWRLRNVAKPTK